MGARHSLFALAVLVTAMAAPAGANPLIRLPKLFQAKPAPSLVFSYDGWRVDAAPAAHAQAPARTVRAVEAQIDLVQHLGLRPDLLDFMRAQKVLVDGAGDPRIEASDYVPGVGVVLHARRLEPKKPILLYALLKAYEAQRLPDGYANPQIDSLRRSAAGRRIWPKTARMLQGDDEYFALTGAAYLYGAITREPYTRADLRKTDPQCFQWMANLFDGGRPRG